MNQACAALFTFNKASEQIVLGRIFGVSESASFVCVSLLQFGLN
jgi:hypothetical protein